MRSNIAVGCAACGRIVEWVLGVPGRGMGDGNVRVDGFSVLRPTIEAHYLAFPGCRQNGRILAQAHPAGPEFYVGFRQTVRPRGVELTYS